MLHAGLMVLSLVVAQAPAADALEEQVRELVRQLAAETPEERDVAEKQLLGLGPSILDHLPIANPRMPAEMRQRVARIRLRLEQVRATSAAAGTRVTLKVDRQPLGEVLAALEKLSGNKIVNGTKTIGDPADPNAEPKITLDVKDMLFWQALDLVLDQTHLTMNVDAANDNGKPIAAIVVETPLVPLAPRGPRSSYSGAFCFAPQTIVAQRGLADPGKNALQVQMEACWEPRLSPIMVTFPRESLAAIFDDGSKATSATQGTDALKTGGAGSPFSLDLGLPPRKAARIKRVSGQLKALLPGRIETFRFGPLPGPGKFQEKKAEVTLSVDRVARNGDAWEIAIRLKFDDAAGALQSHLRGWVDDNKAWLEAADGTKKEYGARDATLEGESEYGVRYVFGVTDIAGYTFVYSTPAALVERTVEFELKDLELP